MNLMTTELTAHPEFYSAFAVTKGGYIGFSFKYFYAFSSFGGGHGADDDGGKLRDDF